MQILCYYMIFTHWINVQCLLLQAKYTQYSHKVFAEIFILSLFIIVPTLSMEKISSSHIHKSSGSSLETTESRRRSHVQSPDTSSQSSGDSDKGGCGLVLTFNII